jgi:hypothetical protein
MGVMLPARHVSCFSGGLFADCWLPNRSESQTPLHYAAFCEKEACVLALLHGGADIDAVDVFSRSALALALHSVRLYFSQFALLPTVVGSRM